MTTLPASLLIMASQEPAFSGVAENFFGSYFQRLSVLTASGSLAELEAAAKLVDETSRAGGQIIVLGNGGSAAIASHVAVDLVKAAGRRARTFHDPSLMTCFANDFGFEEWMAEAVTRFADPVDGLIAISSSGESADIVQAAERALDMGMPVLALSGFSPTNRLRGLGDVSLWADSTEYNMVEITHQNWLLAIVDYLIAIDA